MSDKKEKYDHYRYYFKLFIAGNEPNSRIAYETIKNLCEKYIKNGYEIEVIDVLKDYSEALKNNILLAPTLLVSSPKSNFTIVGSLSDRRKILDLLGISETKEEI